MSDGYDDELSPEEIEALRPIDFPSGFAWTAEAARRVKEGRERRARDFDDDAREYGGSVVREALNCGLEPLRLLDADDLANPPPPAKAFLVERFVPAGEVTLFTGPGGAGKSLLGQQLATAVAAATSFLSLDTIGGPALYVTAEDDERELHWRHSHIVKTLGCSAHQPGLFLSSIRGRIGNELCAFDGAGLLKPTPAFDQIRTFAEQSDAKLIVLDNVAHLFAGNENDRGDVTRFANLLNRLAQDTDAAVLLVAHPNKAGDSYSGSTAWLNAVRSHISLDWKREGERIVDLDARVLKVGKANYARSGSTIDLRWRDFSFMRPEDMPRDLRAEIEQAAKAAADNDLFLACLAIRTAQQRPVSESSASRTFAPRIFAEMAESKGIGSERLEQAMERLFRRNIIERGFVGRIDRKDKEGLRLRCAEVCAEPALTGCADVR